MFSDRRQGGRPNTGRPIDQRTGKADRRDYDGARLRTLLDTLLERIDELAGKTQEQTRSQTELAALLGRVSAVVDLEGLAGPCPCGDMTTNDCAGECGRVEAKAFRPLARNGSAP